MMNIDQARAGGEGLIQPKKQEKELKDLTDDPVFSSQERKLNIEVPEGWSVER
jgi:hypothetical protein